MIQTFGRALRRTAGGGAIFVLGMAAVGSQPQGLVATSAASVSPTTGPTQAEPTPSHDERAAAMAAIRVTAQLAALTVAPSVPAIRRPLSGKRRSVPAVTQAPQPLEATAVPAAVVPAPAVATQPGNSAGYAFGYCTWWVSHKRLIPWHANAAQWWSMARAYGFAEGSVPRVGAVMVMGYGVGGASASSGHVGYVEAVNPNGSFVISEMNWWGVSGGGWGKVDYRTVTSMAGILGFIY